MPPSILLVEDEDDAAALAQYALKQASSVHECLRARNGMEALALATGPTARPVDLILLDLNLPALGGKEVLTRLRADAKTGLVPVVVLSCSDEPSDIADCYARRANSYVRKPLDLRVFTENLSLLLFYWLQLNIPPVESAIRRDVRRASTGVHAEFERSRPFVPPRTLGAAADHLAALEAGRDANTLVVDRDPETRARTVRALREVAGKTAVVEAASGEEATRLLATARMYPGRSPWENIQLVLLDLDRHPEDGPEMVARIREFVDHHLPIVVFTRNDDPGFVDTCYALGVNSVVRKADELDYDDTVRLLGAYWLRLNESLPPGSG